MTVSNDTYPKRHSLTRRDFLRLTAGAGALLAASDPRAGAVAERKPVDLELALRAQPEALALFPGAPTRVWRYTAKVIQGDPASVSALPDTYLGPILRLRRGSRVRITLDNGLTEDTNVHWHGLHVPERMDGHPRDVARPGGQYVYEFEVRDRAGTYWFHPHTHGRTGAQIYQGLTGLLLVGDDAERALDLPDGAQDVPLVLQDRTLGSDNQFAYIEAGMPMMQRMMGFLGDRILVNGRPDFVLPVATRAYRLRLLNASSARVYKLAWRDGTPLTVIATDGGLLARPVERPYVTLAPAERIELWADFSGRRVGETLALESLPFAGGMAMGGGMMGRGGMMNGMMGGRLPNGAAFPVLTVRVARQESESRRLPAQLATLAAADARAAVNANAPRRFGLTMGQMEWSINGRSFEMEAVARDEIVRLDTTEVWEFANDRARMMAMPHPLHVHGVQFRVLERSVARGGEDAWNTVRAGYVDEGYKDTLLLMPGERARVLLRFADYPGLFVFHCHNLEHGDMGMMRNYRVRA